VNDSGIATVILCGGKGTRAYPHTAEVPKPLMDVAGTPILRHVMQIYADQGHTRFVLAAGYLVDLVEKFAEELPSEWSVDVVDTGEDTNTGRRIELCRDRLTPTFFATYGDGVGDVSLDALLWFHRSHNATATVTVVPLPSQYGTMEFDADSRVRNFREKPVLGDHWINAGFFVMNDAVFETWKGEDLERDVLPGLAADGSLFAYRHQGFWKSMDTHKDAVALTTLADNPNGRPPWLRSPINASS
jgi:glucose-1-phosphate cytidylyltransferase